MNGLLSFASLCDGLSRSLGKMVGWLMLPLIFTIMFDVVTRKIDITRLFFSDFTVESGYSVSTILQDMQWHFHGAILLLSFGYGYITNAHVRVDVFREMCKRRTQAWMEFVLLIVLALPFLAILIVYSWTLFYLSWAQWEGSDSMTGVGWRWFIKFFMFFGFVVVMASVIATIIRLYAYLFGEEFQSKDAEAALEIFADDSAALEEARRAAEEALRREARGA